MMASKFRGSQADRGRIMPRLGKQEPLVSETPKKPGSKGTIVPQIRQIVNAKLKEGASLDDIMDEAKLPEDERKALAIILSSEETVSGWDLGFEVNGEGYFYGYNLISRLRTKLLREKDAIENERISNIKQALESRMELGVPYSEITEKSMLNRNEREVLDAIIESEDPRFEGLARGRIMGPSRVRRAILGIMEKTLDGGPDMVKKTSLEKIDDCLTEMLSSGREYDDIVNEAGLGRSEIKLLYVFMETGRVLSCRELAELLEWKYGRTTTVIRNIRIKLLKEEVGEGNKSSAKYAAERNEEKRDEYRAMADGLLSMLISATGAKTRKQLQAKNRNLHKVAGERGLLDEFFPAKLERLRRMSEDELIGEIEKLGVKSRGGLRIKDEGLIKIAAEKGILEKVFPDKFTRFIRMGDKELIEEIAKLEVKSRGELRKRDRILAQVALDKGILDKVFPFKKDIKKRRAKRRKVDGDQVSLTTGNAPLRVTMIRIRDVDAFKQLFEQALQAQTDGRAGKIRIPLEIEGENESGERIYIRIEKEEEKG